MEKSLGRFFFSIALVSFLSFNIYGTGYKNETVINLGNSTLRLRAISPAIIRITHSASGNFSKRKSLSVIENGRSNFRFSVKQTEAYSEISTDSLKIRVDKTNGTITFLSKAGSTILLAGAKTNDSFIKKVVDSEEVFSIKQFFIFSEGEGLFGLGQFEDGIMNFRGHDVILAQANRVAVNPFLVSSKGYGILWDNYSVSNFHDGKDGSYFSSDVADEIDYYFVYGSGSIDKTISGYRKLTGKAPMFAKWAYGFWQSKERYMNSSELIGIIKEYRRRNIPIDNVIQDWQYWGEMDNFSGMSWDSLRYKNPKAMMDTLHMLNAHMIASIWPAFGNKSLIYKELELNNLLFNQPHWCGGKVYDAYNPLARKIYWKHLKKAFLDNDVDGYWMDGSEPEYRCTDDRFITAQTIIECGNNYLGSMSRYVNPYSLMHTKGVYENQREAANNKRVFILTRSAFTGQQRFASVTWSGDIFASFQTLKNQIAAGINFSISGIPYWTTDIGAFITAFKYPEGVKDDSYKELYVRWFQFGAFCPIFRSHGTNTPREVWQFGEKGQWAYDALVKTDRLRYRLMPYIYSNAWKVTNEGYTMLRGLVMDFPNDAKGYSIQNEYMFGANMLVCPVTKELFNHSSVKGEDIESSFFFTKDGNQNGLDLQVYEGMKFNKHLITRKFDASQLGWSGCLPNGLDTSYSIKMEGKILSDNKGEYTFKIITDGGVRMWIDNKLLIDNWSNITKTDFYAKVNMDENTKYDFKIEHNQPVKNNALIKVNWIKPEVCTPDSSFEVYLPESKEKDANTWFDFWTGKTFQGGQTIKREAPIDILPLYVPAGSIIPYGPEVQYAEEKKDGPVELRIYKGKDASFTIYEDEGDNYNYEKGSYSTIPVKWNEKTGTLTIGKRQGRFPGMIKEKTFNIVLVKENHGSGLESTVKPDKAIRYSGKEIKVSF